MKRAAAFAAAIACACGSQKPKNLPVIVSFKVDNANPLEADAITFSYVVQNAAKVSLYPQPAGPIPSPYTLVPIATDSYVLRAENGDGQVERTLSIVVQKAPPVRVTRFNASPAQSQPGQSVTLSWAVQNAVRVEFNDGSGAAPKDVTQLSSMIVQPQATTLYTLTAYAKQGRTPATHSGFTAARILEDARGILAVDPAHIQQGSAATLSWSGDALSWAIRDDAGHVTALGPLRSLRVSPPRTTTYTLLATGPAGTVASGSVTVTVDARPSSALVSSGATASRPLRLETTCNGQTCTASLFAAAAIQLRGLALDLPVDATKISASGLALDPQVFAAGASTGKLALGSGPLQNTLVLGAARIGSGSAVAPDASLLAGAHLLDFTLTLRSEGGVGPVFDGSGARSFVQGAQGRTSDAIAVGTLLAQ